MRLIVTSYRFNFHFFVCSHSLLHILRNLNHFRGLFFSFLMRIEFEKNFTFFLRREKKFSTYCIIKIFFNCFSLFSMEFVHQNVKSRKLIAGIFFSILFVDSCMMLTRGCVIGTYGMNKQVHTVSALSNKEKES